MQDAKGIIEKFFSKVTMGQIEEAFDLVDDAVQWWVPEELPFSGTKNKAEYFAIVQRIKSGFPSGFKMIVKDMILQGNKAAVEVESQGQHINGKVYNNKYHFLITIEAGKFKSVKEYMNTLHLARLIA